MSSTAVVGEHARDQSHTPPLRDQIVLSHTELFDAHRIGATCPRRAMTFLADEHDAGREVPARLAAKYREAAEFVIACGLLPVYDDPKPEPTVTARTTTRVLPAIQTDSHGDRVLDGPGYGFVWVETPDPSAPADELFEPHLVVEGIVRESDLDGFRADADRFAREITAPVESSWSKAGAA